MGCEVFRFKKFTIHQQNCAMKVGTDGTLIGAWCRILPQDKLSLDIGTGTGLIAIMLAQRSIDANRIFAIECDCQSAMQAKENIAKCPWHNRISLICDTIQHFTDNDGVNFKFDHIVSNPPYFSESLLPPDAKRTRARHTVDLSYEELMRCSQLLLSEKGRLSLIIPESESMKMISLSKKYGFHTSRQTAVKTTPDGETKRLLIEFSRADIPVVTDTLTIETEHRGEFSKEYREMTEDFYLKF